MADGHPVSQHARKFIGQMQHGIVLHVGMMAHDSAVDVAAQNSPVPDAAVRAERDITDDSGGFGDENTFTQARLFAEKLVELRVEFGHDGSLAKYLFHPNQSFSSSSSS